MMDRLIRYTMLAVIAGVILAFNMYHADYKLLVAQVGTIALVAIWLLRAMFKAEPRTACSRLSLEHGAMLVFLGVCVLSFILSPHKLASGQELYKIGTWIVFGMIIGGLKSEEGDGRGFASDIVNIWLVCAGIVAIYGILQFFGIDFMKLRLANSRIVSTFGNATLLAGFLAMTMPVALARALESKRAISHQLSAISLMIALLTCLILTKSRGGILAAIVGIELVYILRVRSGSSRTVTPSLARVAILGLIVASTVLLILPYSRHIIFDVILRRTARIYLWKDAIQMVRLHPIFGTGIGTFGLYFPHFVTEDVLRTHPIGAEFVNHAHCEYLEILMEMGIVGLVAFLAVVVMPFTLTLSQKRGKDEGVKVGLFAAFIAILVHNVVGVDLRYTSTGMFFWMIVGMLGVKKSEAVSCQLSAFRLVKDSRLQKIALGLIIIVAIVAIYFTLRPYMYIYRIEEQNFFAIDTRQLDERIRKLEKPSDSIGRVTAYSDILSLIDQIPTYVDKTDDVKVRFDVSESADYYFNLGVLHAKKKDFQKAIEYFVETIRVDPHHAGAYNNLGNIAFLQEDPGGAKELFHRAVMAEPDNVDYIVNFAYACFKVNLMSEAMEAIEKVLKIDPKNNKAMFLKRQMTQ